MMDGQDRSVGSVVGLMNVLDGEFLNGCDMGEIAFNGVESSLDQIIPDYLLILPFFSLNQLLVNIACGVWPQASAVRCRIRQQK